MTIKKAHFTDLDDEQLAVGRFVDQPGQWICVTPEETRKQQEAAWKEYEEKYLSNKPTSHKNIGTE